MFLRAHSQVTAATEDALEDAGLMSIREYDILVTLEMADDHELRMNDLARRAVYSRSGLSRLVGRLEDKGWVVRLHCEDDGRAVWCRLTKQGQRARERAWPVISGCIHQFFGAHLSSEEAQTILAVMTRMLHAAGG